MGLGVGRKSSYIEDDQRIRANRSLYRSHYPFPISLSLSLSLPFSLSFYTADLTIGEINDALSKRRNRSKKLSNWSTKTSFIEKRQGWRRTYESIRLVFARTILEKYGAFTNNFTSSGIFLLTEIALNHLYLSICTNIRPFVIVRVSSFVIKRESACNFCCETRRNVMFNRACFR